ncbi:MAG TPA: PAS domain-containing protein [Stellaceae bacterium]|nr:PAS domain-containing protein [Stellaceae bacterium]
MLADTAMVVDAERLRRRAGWAGERVHVHAIRRLTSFALVVAGVGGGFGILYLARVVSGMHVVMAAFVLTALAGLAAIAFMAARVLHAAVAHRLDILIQALDASPDAQLILSPDGRLAHANIAFHELFPDEGEPPLERIERALAAAPESQADFRRLRDRGAAGARAIAALSLRNSRGGAAGRFNISVNPIAGRPGYTLWNVQDITAQHEMEAVIRDERNKLVDFLDNAPVGFYSVDAQGRFLFVNQTLAQWLGSTAAEIVAGAQRLHDFLETPPPEGTPPFEAAHDPQDGVERAAVVFMGLQGRRVHAAVRQSVVGAEGELRTRSVVRDLTPEREWETALRLSRERFQRFFVNAPVGIALLDRFGRLEEVNRAVGELFGAPAQDLIGQPLIGFLFEEDRRDFTVRLAAAAAGEPGQGPLEARLKRPREKTLAVYLSRLDGGEDSDGGVILHFIDVTEQKNLELQFGQSQKMQAVGQLAGGVAHDFNNLLTAMIGFCDLLLLRFRPGDPSFADIMQIKQNANRAANLVRQLLAFSRQQTLQPRILDITDVLVELSHLLRRLIGENIELKVVLGRDLGLAKVDQGQLEQVIINLAVNARDAMPNGGRLQIRTANVSQARPVRRGLEVMPAGEYVLIEVADTGVGIAPENLVRIFEPFFSTKEVGSGTGLGLSTVYGIVKQTGGFIFVDSAPGRGATFEIHLPRHEAVEGALPARPEAVETPLASKDLTGIGTVMLVEDDDPVRIFSARALRNKGYRVIEASSGEAALELIREGSEKIDLLVTDVVMPRIDGPGLIREVRELYPGMKVIFISGYAEDSFRQRLDADSELHFLPKPFSLKQLASKVKELMEEGEA